MPGARYDGWHHLRYVGDRELAAQHLPLARKVLGFVRDQAAANGLQTYKHVVELDDGGLIVGELIGGQLRATIDVRGGGKGGYQPLVEGFILRFTEELDSGARKPDPGVITLPAEDAPDDPCGVLFYAADSFGATETPREYRGTYSHVFGPRQKLTSQLPAGALWTSQDGEVVSWFRGFAGYWPAHYAHPGAPYGGYVAIYGNVVFVVPNTSDRVMAAAARDGHLYVWIASGLWEYPNYTPPAAPAICGDIWVTQPYPDMAHVFRLYRLPLEVTTDARGIQVYKASNIEDGELLLDTPLPRAWGAWTFNRDVTKLVSIQLPEKAVFYQRAAYREHIGSLGEGYSPSSDEHSDMPTSGTLRFEIAIAHSNGMATATFSQAPAGAIVAEEDGTTLELVQHELSLATRDHHSQVNYKCGDWELLAARSDDVWGSGSGGDLRYAERNILLAAHLPTKSFLFYNVKYQLRPTPGFVHGRYRVFRQAANGGIEEVVGVDSAPLEASGSSLAVDLLLGGVISIMGCGALNPEGTAFTWFRPWDGPTTLLTLTYNRSFVTIHPPSGEESSTHDTAWLPIWAGPMINFSWALGSRYGAGGVYFGSRNFHAPWSWSWSEGDWGPEAHKVHFNGTRLTSLDAKTFNIHYLHVNAASYKPPESATETAYIADASPIAIQAAYSYGTPEEAALLATLAEVRRLRWTSRGDASAALAGLDAALSGGSRLARVTVLGHTGKPRREQQGGFVTP